MDTIAVSGIVISCLLGTGSVAFFVRYGTRLSLLERLIETSQLVTLHPRLALVESSIHDMKSDVKSSLSKLGSLDLISQKLDSLVEKISQIVPRNEQELRFSQIENDIAELKKQG
jgi:hypothetical protein